MCGIAGIVRRDGHPVDPRELRALNNALAHRGPDDEGYVLIAPGEGAPASFRGPASDARIRSTLRPLPETPDSRASIGFCHRRFSIIDLSPGGHQPLVDEESGHCLTFNGEIYNYIEVREKLIAAGCRFRTQSDTEVLLRAYQHWGVECFAELNGFWACALYDPRTRSVVLSRDRIGVKPLYYTVADGAVYFASEIKAFLAVPALRKRAAPDRLAIQSWLRSGIKDHEERTFFRDIRRFPAASYAVIDAEFPSRIRRFWTLPDRRLTEKEISVEEACSTLRETLTEATRIRLRADVPLALELSGGLDSSSILAVAAHELGRKLVTFTVRFEDPNNEEPFARAAAESCGAEMIVIDPEAGSFWKDVAAFTWLEEEPYHSPTLQSDQQVWSIMRDRGFRVGLCGAAGDECLGGYAYHYTLRQLERLRSLDLKGYVSAALECVDAPSKRASLVKPPLYWLLRRHGLTPFLRGPVLVHRSGRVRLPMSLAARMRADMLGTLMPYWLCSGDKAYMGVPIEIREPFLDYRMVEFAFRLPLDYLVREGWQKWILRKAIEPLLPASIVWRQRKMGFPFPYGTFRREHADAFSSIAKRAAKNPFVILHDRVALRDDWRLASYVLWYEYFIKGDMSFFDELGRSGAATAAPPSCAFSPAYLERDS